MIVQTAAALALLVAFVVAGPMGCGKLDEDTTPTSSTTNGTDTTGTTTGTTNTTGTSGTTTDGTKDALDPALIHWDAQTNPTSYKIIDVNFKMGPINGDMPAPTMCWSWDRPTSWPVASNGKSIGNNWVIAKVNGEWHATPWEHVPPSNRSCRTTEALSGDPPFVQGYGAIAASWYPKSGEEVYWMNSIICRGPVPAGSPKERTAIVRFDWP